MTDALLLGNDNKGNTALKLADTLMISTCPAIKVTKTPPGRKVSCIVPLRISELIMTKKEKPMTIYVTMDFGGHRGQL